MYFLQLLKVAVDTGSIPNTTQKIPRKSRLLFRRILLSLIEYHVVLIVVITHPIIIKNERMCSKDVKVIE